MSARASTVEPRNSSTSVLGVSGTFTGESVDVASWASVSVMVRSDVDSLLNGLKVQQSTDGTNWDVLREFTVKAKETLTVGVDVVARFLRVVYENDGAAQSEFRLQTVCHMNTQATLLGTGPEEFLSVRITDGDNFNDGALQDSTHIRTMLAVESLLLEQKITNLHLSKITNEAYTEEDIE